LQSDDKEHDDLVWVCNGIVVHNCFPKDINAMIKVADGLGVDTPVLDAAWKKNNEVRPERDWEKMIGRAVSKKTEK
jgi:UDP-glucose 6-dehydrogenase